MRNLDYRNISKDLKWELQKFCLFFFKEDYYKGSFNKKSEYFYFYEKRFIFNKKIKFNFYKLLYEILPSEISYRNWKSPDLIPHILSKIIQIVSNEYATDNEKMKDILFLLYSEANRGIHVNLKSEKFDYSKFLIEPPKALRSKFLEKKKQVEDSEKTVQESKTVFTIVHNVINNSSTIKKKKFINRVAIASSAAMLFLFLNVATLLINYKLNEVNTPYCYIKQFNQKEEHIDSS